MVSLSRKKLSTYECKLKCEIKLQCKNDPYRSYFCKVKEELNFLYYHSFNEKSISLKPKRLKLKPHQSTEMYYILKWWSDNLFIPMLSLETTTSTENVLLRIGVGMINKMKTLTKNQKISFWSHLIKWYEKRKLAILTYEIEMLPF